MRLFGLTQPCFRICLANGAKSLRLAELLERLLDRGEVVLRQRARIGPRIGQHLVPLVERLGERQRHARREAEAAVRLALQAGQVVEQRRELRGGLGLLAGDAALAAAGGDDRFGLRLRPTAARPCARRRSSFLNFGVEPAAGVFARLARRSAPCTSQ